MSKILIHNFGGLFLESGPPKQKRPQEDDGREDKTKKTKTWEDEDELYSLIKGLEFTSDDGIHEDELIEETDAEIINLFNDDDDLLTLDLEGLDKELEEYEKQEQKEREQNKRSFIIYLIKKLQEVCGVEDDNTCLIEIQVLTKLRLVLIFNFVLALLYLERNDTINGGQKKAKNIKNVFNRFAKNRFAKVLRLNEIRTQIVKPNLIKKKIIERNLKTQLEFILFDDQLRIRNTRMKTDVLAAKVDSSKLVQFYFI